MSREETLEAAFKIALLGDAGVGKTSLINQYVEHKFKHDYMPTLGVNLLIKDIKVDEDFTDIKGIVRLTIWDIAGQEQYDGTRNIFFSGAQGALIVYDITSRKSFDNVVTKWLADMEKYGGKRQKYVLIGNKSDLADSRVIEKDEAAELAKFIKAADFIETSAKNGDNVDSAFYALVKQILKEHL